MSITITSPITKTTNVKLIGEQPVQLIIDSYRKKYGVDVSRYFYSQDKTQIVQCLDSNYIFYYPFVLGDSEFYEELEKFDWYYKPEKWDYDQSIVLIPSGASVLEVGSGFGFFLKKLREKECEVEAVELNRSATEILRKQGFNVHNISLEHFSESNPDNKYDYICAFQLMEHIPNVGEFLTIYSKHLKNGGKLIIGVPNNKSILLDYRVNTLNLPPHHAGLWSEDFFNAIPKCFPSFTLDKVHYEPVSLKNRIDAGIFSAKIKHKSKSLAFFLTLPFSILKSFLKPSQEISMHIIGILTKI